MRPAALVLEDGRIFEGMSFGADRDAFGEVVFNTGMTGYQEVLTDPSYDGQIVTMTYPHIGNYGVNDQDVESRRPWVAGFVVRDLPPAWSSWRGRRSLAEYLERAGVVGIAEVDTRALTRHIRSKGAMRGAISVGEAEPGAMVERVRAHPSIVGADLVPNVSTTAPYEWPCEHPRFAVAAYDFGIKLSILRTLAGRGCSVTVYPARTPPEELLAEGPDGVFLSNGPGDPEAVCYGVEAIRKLIGAVPVFGICLGHQLMARAVGFGTYKLPFGHHGVNHPVARLSDAAVEITTQNHGFAVSPELFGYEPPAFPGAALPKEVTAESAFGKAVLTHLNLNDYTIEGFRLLEEPAFCVQYHPEAGPGPHDARYLFDDFCQIMEWKGTAHGKR
ncbi:MAG: glutamine-hydrolyzing carbamoyl-phosphate synthase small subunit [Actinomycetota bacterium]